jgi:hypothetical protein
MVAEEPLDAEPLEEAGEDGQGADPSRVEGASLGMGGFARRSSLLVSIHPSCSRRSSRGRSRGRRRAPTARKRRRRGRRAVRRHDGPEKKIVKG